MKNKIAIGDLYFGVKIPKISFMSDTERSALETYNLFEFSRVKTAVAMWVLSDSKFRMEHDFSKWCFSSVWSRCEHEWLVARWPDNESDTLQKVDIYGMYVEPNKNLLKYMVEMVSKSSAKRYLRERRKLRK